jgi:hypothetical protein
MKATNQKKYAGGRKVVQGPRQTEAHTGRKQNQEHKSKFSAGPHAKNDPNAARSNGPLLPLHQVEVRRRRKK